MPDVVDRVRDAVYITVGLGVLAYQKVQVQRRELRKSLGSPVEALASSLERRLAATEERFDDVEDRVEDALEKVREWLPDQLRNLSGTKSHSSHTSNGHE